MALAARRGSGDRAELCGIGYEGLRSHAFQGPCSRHGGGTGGVVGDGEGPLDRYLPSTQNCASRFFLRLLQHCFQGSSLVRLIPWTRSEPTHSVGQIHSLTTATGVERQAILEISASGSPALTKPRSGAMQTTRRVPKVFHCSFLSSIPSQVFEDSKRTWLCDLSACRNLGLPLM